MKKISRLRALTLLIVPVLTGCASTGGKMLRITSEPDSAGVVVFDREGKALGKTATPVSFAVKDDYSYIEISKDGYDSQRIVIGREVKRKFNSLYLLNFAVAAGGAGAGIALNRAAAGGTDNHFIQTASYYAFGLGALGVVGAIADPLAGSLTQISPHSVHVTLREDRR
jgi:hypothetical protein